MQHIRNACTAHASWVLSNCSIVRISPGDARKTNKARELDATACIWDLSEAVRRAVTLNWATKAIAFDAGEFKFVFAPTWT